MAGNEFDLFNESVLYTYSPFMFYATSFDLIPAKFVMKEARINYDYELNLYIRLEIPSRDFEDKCLEEIYYEQFSYVSEENMHIIENLEDIESIIIYKCKDNSEYEYIIQSNSYTRFDINFPKELPYMRNYYLTFENYIDIRDFINENNLKVYVRENVDNQDPAFFNEFKEEEHNFDVYNDALQKIALKYDSYFDSPLEKQKTEIKFINNKRHNVQVRLPINKQLYDKYDPKDQIIVKKGVYYEEIACFDKISMEKYRYLLVHPDVKLYYIIDKQYYVLKFTSNSNIFHLVPQEFRSYTYIFNFWFRAL